LAVGRWELELVVGKWELEVAVGKWELLMDRPAPLLLLLFFLRLGVFNNCTETFPQPLFFV
jgi:hypothetical protein